MPRSARSISQHDQPWLASLKVLIPHTLVVWKWGVLIRMLDYDLAVTWGRWGCYIEGGRR